MPFMMKTNHLTAALTVALSVWLLFTVSWQVRVGKASNIGVGRASLHGHVVPRAQWRSQQRDIRVNYTPQTDKTSFPTNALQGRNVVVRHLGRVVKRRNKTAVNDPRRVLVHLHIAKSGGTSLDDIGEKLAHDSGRRYFGNYHFDWSRIDEMPNVTNVDVVMLLRHPVSRAESHFHYIKDQEWTRQLRMYNQTIEEYLHDPESLLQCLDVWQDQQASIMWLTGNHIASWVSRSISPKERDKREQRGFDHVKMCHLAAKRLNQTLWFGILEDSERSMELLQHALKLNYRPQLPKSNVGMKKPKIQKISEWSRKALESLMPQDIWLYNYAKALFEARWTEYKTGVFVEPELPPLPDLPCRSNRFELNCTAGPLAESGPLYFQRVH